MRCLVHAPYSFSGRGPAESCAQIAGGMAATGLWTEVWAGRIRTPLPPGVRTHAPFFGLGRRLPWQPVEKTTLRVVEQQFRRTMAKADPASTVLLFWPGTSADLVAEARDRGIPTVREMTNSTMANARHILDEAYGRLGLPPTHNATAQAAAGESAELALYDYFMAPNPEVERSLVDLGIRPDQILSVSFGWSPERYAGARPIERAAGFRATFVGSIGVRKGVPELLEAWSSLDIDGELLLVGAVDAEIEHLVQEHIRGGRVRLQGYVDNPGAIYAASDVFVFPTLEEGGPQVTYEAAGFGLPVVTTPMGAARLVEDGRTGLIVPPASAPSLAKALATLADDVTARQAYGAAAKAAAAAFTYDRVGAQRASALRSVLMF